jgi:hypothetical protein
MPMTGRIELFPSPFDRLDPVARAVRWWTSQMADILGRPARKTAPAEILEADGKIAAGHVAIVLKDTDAFVARLALPRGHASSHQNALLLKLPDITPGDPAKLKIAAVATDAQEEGGVGYAIAMARPQRLALLERQARKKGARSVRFQPEGAPAIELRSPAADRREQRRLIFDAALAVILVASATAAVAIWTGRVQQETAALAGQERELRRAAVASETVRRNAEIARELVSRGILDRRAGSALSALADLNKATPDGAWWTSVRWSSQETTVSAQATDAAKAIELISKNAKGWTVELGGAINATAAGAPQTFDLTLRPRQGAPK